MKERKAQEEMVGFVMIMLVVAIIFVILLGLYIRANTNTVETGNEEMSDFLGAAFEYTTECNLCNGGPCQVQELIIKCDEYRGAICLESNYVCEVLYDELQNLTEAGWDFGEDSPYSDYEISVLREDPRGDISVFCPNGAPLPGEPREEEFDRICSVRSPGTGGGSTGQSRVVEKPLPGGIILRLRIWI